MLVRRFPVRPRDTRRHSWLSSGSCAARGSAKEETRWAEESVGSAALFVTWAGTARVRPGLLRPYLFGTTILGVPLVPGGRCSSRACTTSRSPTSASSATFLACRGFIFNSAPEAALADKLYGIGDRPSGVVGLGFDPAPPGDAGAFRRRHGLEGPLLVYLGRKETGKNVPLLIQYCARRPPRGSHAGPGG